VLTVRDIAEHAGTAHFAQRLGTSPGGYRAAFRAPGAGGVDLSRDGGASVESGATPVPVNARI
jgi:hypothetical protein